MKIGLTSIMVDDQPKAIAFYTDTLGFRVAQRFPVGEYEWIGLIAPDGPEDVQLSLEPAPQYWADTNHHGLYDNGIPATAFQALDLQADHDRLVAKGVVFKGPPAARRCRA